MSRERLRGLSLDADEQNEPGRPVLRRPTVIALGFERTFTADVNLWKALIVGGARKGHVFLLITTLRDTAKHRARVDRILGDIRPHFRAVLYTNGAPKRAFAATFGHKVDIWIDDLPEVVGAPTFHEVREIEGRYPNSETLPL